MRKILLEGRVAARLLGAAIVLALLLPGLIGHDPWKPDEAYTFGLVHHILDTGEWVVPTLAGEPFMEKPPLYYVVAAGFAWLLAPVLPLHDGARVASLLFVCIALLFTGLAARRLEGPGHGVRAVLLMAGSLGLAMHSHTMITDVALLAGFALAVHGLTWALTHPLRAGAWIGTGVGVGFMSKGLVEPAMLGLALVALPIVFREWRCRAYAASLAWALAIASPWLLAWPALLYFQDSAAFVDWLWTNNFGRYFGFAQLGASDEPWYFTRTLPWFTFPSGALALFAAIRALRSGELMRSRTLQITLAVTGGIAAILGTSSSARELYALPILVPLAILATRVVDQVPRGVAIALTRLMGLLAIAVALFAWGVWSFAILKGHPPAVPFLVGVLPMDFSFPLDPVAVAAALVIVAIWCAAWKSKAEGWLPRWTANLALGWGVCMMLLLPWLDNAKSFRDPFMDLATRLPHGPCISSVGLGEGQRGMLDYVAGVKTQRVEIASTRCPYLIAQTTHDGTLRELPEGVWDLVWRGSRNGESREAFLLYEERSEIERLALEAPLLAAASHLGEPRRRQHGIHSGAVRVWGRGDSNDAAVRIEHRPPARRRSNRN